MASYEDDHNLPNSSANTTITTPSTSSSSQAQTPLPPSNDTTTRRNRLNLNEFFQRLPATTTSTSSSSPDVSALLHLLASSSSLALSPILESLFNTLSGPQGGSVPKGVPEGWTDQLERIPKKSLKPDDICPICNSAFLEDQYPLVVRLPCHERHIFDLECLQVWLRVQATCPLDRTDLLKKQQPAQPPAPPPPKEDEEEEWDDNYG